MEYILGGIILFSLCIVFLVVIAKLLGIYSFKVFEGKITVLQFLEKRIYRFCKAGSERETSWRRYTIDVMLFNIIGIIFLFSILTLQSFLPLNPQNLKGFTWDLALNTAVSFVTNTNWQAYPGGESTASYFTQMLGLAVQNFLSAATGICVAIALMRSLARQGSATIGNFWVDITRCTLYLLLPFCFIFALLLISQGAIQNFDSYVTTLGAGGKEIIPMGPVASQEAIKEFGTNGGGFFNANSAHPYENPNPLTNILEILLILSIPFALTHTFGLMVKDTRQGWSIFLVMLFLLFSACFFGYFAELQGNPLLKDSDLRGRYVEGKETRFSVAESVLFASATTATSTGAVNTMHDSLTPLGGLAPIFLILLGEIAPGGAGSGIYTMLPYVIIAVFIAGLMVGRSPQYLGKKIDALDMKASVVIVLVSPILVLAFSAIALVLPEGISSIYNPGPHGLSEVLYAYASMSNNNGSAFGGLNTNTVFYNLTGALAMFLGRFVPLVAALALAGSMAKKTIYSSRDVFYTHNLTFIAWLIGVIILIDTISFLPALALGPIIEQIFMLNGGVF